MNVRYLSTFSGIGGFELGIGEHGACVGCSEIDKYAVQIYQHHFPNHTNYGDITTINERELPDFDLLVGGFPCQAFSIAGTRGGFADTRGTMFFELTRIIKHKQPHLLLLENVKGLLSHNKGATFATVISTLDELGYDAQWQVLNSKNHGTAHDRERTYVIGHRRGTSRPQVFPFHSQPGDDKKEREIIQVNRPNHSGYRYYSLDGVSPTLRARGRADWHASPKVVSQGGIRNLTPVECERLQGFPDDWTATVPTAQRYKTLGNAVTVNVIRHIAERMLIL